MIRGAKIVKIFIVQTLIVNIFTNFKKIEDTSKQ